MFNLCSSPVGDGSSPECYKDFELHSQWAEKPLEGFK